MSRIRVGVVRGGPSPEYEVSLKTGQAVLGGFLTEKYQPIDILIDRSGMWHVRGQPFEPSGALAQVDVIFNALHGAYGEDGGIQSLLDSFGMPYTGSGRLGSSLAMNKPMAVKLFNDAGLLTPRHFMVSEDLSAELAARQIFSRLSPPWVIKPSAAGSSVGVSIVRQAPGLAGAIDESRNYSPTVLAEEFIRGREATVGVIENYRDKKIYPLFPIEICPPAENKFFDYDAKYSGRSKELCPGRFSEDEKRALEEAAVTAHQALSLRHYSRSDFIVSPRGVYILEVNTLPGLTTESLLPKALMAVGIPYGQFLDHLISLALAQRGE